MVEVPDRLECLFTASLDQRGDAYTIEIPPEELTNGSVSTDETYRVAVLPTPPQNTDTTLSQEDDSSSPTDSMAATSRTPPVEEGDVREVTIETLGDQGDGITKIDRGYVVIVPGTRPDDEVTVEIEQTRKNVAFARVYDDSADVNAPGEPVASDESFEGDTLGTEE